MKKIMYFLLIGITIALIVSMAAVAQVSEEVKELQDAVGYKWQPAEVDEWNTGTLSYKKIPPIPLLFPQIIWE